MKVVILAGGFGTRLSEYTKSIPKPMVNINGKPILIHIMDHYSKYGYKGNFIKRYFQKNKKTNYRYKVNLIDTGLKTMTGGRLKRLKDLLSDETFLLTYGDGVSNVNLKKLLSFHKKNKKLITLTAVRPPARFGAIKILGNKVKTFKEKSKLDEGWINGGFFVVEPKFLNLIKGDSTFLEREPLESASKKNQLLAFKHHGFWQCMDTKRDKDFLEKNLKKYK